MRLSDQTELRDVEILMKQNWGLKEWPKVLISVLGGVHGFDLKPNIANNLKKELRNVRGKLLRHTSSMISEK